MPGYDRSGPAGNGPMTGGMRGFCNPAATGYRASYWGCAGMGRRPGGGRGFRGGMGQGRRGRFAGGSFAFPPAVAGPYGYDPSAEIDELKAQADSLRNSLDAISKRIAQLEESAE